MSEQYTLSSVFSLPCVTFGERRELPTVGGIYFVTAEEAVLYVGKAQSLRARWGAHHRAPQMEPHYRIHWIECGEEIDRTSLEVRLIADFLPPWNFAPVESTSKSLVYRQTLSESLAARVEQTRSHFGLSIQEITMAALALFCDKHGPK